MAQILIVDDEKIALTMLESLLTKAGHKVTTASDANDAIQKVKARPFDMVITDARMPGSSGFDLVRHLRIDADLKHLKIILLTGLREKRDVERGIQAGVDGYLVKPIDPKILKEKVDALLAGQTLQAAPAVDVPWREEARYVEALNIVSISADGVSFQSVQPFYPGSHVQIDAKVFADAGLKTPMLKILKCMPIEGAKHLVRAQFADVNVEFKDKLVQYIEAKAKVAS